MSNFHRLVVAERACGPAPDAVRAVLCEHQSRRPSVILQPCRPGQRPVVSRQLVTRL